MSLKWQQANCTVLSYTEFLGRFFPFLWYINYLWTPKISQDAGICFNHVNVETPPAWNNIQNVYSPDRWHNMCYQINHQTCLVRDVLPCSGCCVISGILCHIQGGASYSGWCVVFGMLHHIQDAASYSGCCIIFGMLRHIRDVASCQWVLPTNREICLLSVFFLDPWWTNYS